MNPTAQQQILQMLQDNTSPPDIVRTIVAEPCPYRKEELTLALQHCWREMESVFDERAVYQIDDQRRSRWPTMQDTIHTLLQQARNAQKSTTPTITPTNQIVKPTKPTTMPIIVHKQEGSINNYENCVFNHYTTATPQQPEPPLAEEVVAIDMSLFAEDHVPSYVEQEIKLALRAAKSKAERAKAMYALQERGLINLDQYPSDEERAKQLNLHQDICQFSPDSIQRGRQLWEES